MTPTPRKNDDPNSAFLKAVANNDCSTALDLIQTRGVNPAMRENEALKIVCEKGHIYMAMLLLQDNRVDPSVDDNICIQIASEFGHVGLVKALLQDERLNIKMTL